MVKKFYRMSRSLILSFPSEIDYTNIYSMQVNLRKREE